MSGLCQDTSPAIYQSKSDCRSEFILCQSVPVCYCARKALPAYQTLKYLYESMGIVPWLGSETSEGPSKPLGDNYFQLSAKGLSKELGFVGGYGEILHWMLRVYEITGVCGETDSRDPLIRAQLLKVLKARGYFRYPSVDEDGNKAMLAEAVIGWRDHGKYPGTILYGEKDWIKKGIL